MVLVVLIRGLVFAAVVGLLTRGYPPATILAVVAAAAAAGVRLTRGVIPALAPR